MNWSPLIWIAAVVGWIAAVVGVVLVVLLAVGVLHSGAIESFGNIVGSNVR